MSSNVFEWCMDKKLIVKIKKINIPLLTIFLLSLNSCSNDSIKRESQDNYVYKIMPLGASRVQGNRPIYESYRYELWKKLIKENYPFDFIGTQSDTASYPIFNNYRFDIDHEGRSGWTSKQILNNINSWLNEIEIPDIVLFSSPGGNDAIQNLPYNQTIENINGIIDALQEVNPNILIIIEQLAPLKTEFMSIDYKNYFNNLQQAALTISKEQSTVNSQVITADMFSSFNDSFLADGVHYNEEGANFIADIYYSILINK